MSAWICQGKPEYGWFKKVQALEPHRWMEWRAGARSLDKHFKPDDNQASFKEPHVWDGLLMDGDEVEMWDRVAGVEIAISRVKGLSSNSAKLHETIYQISVADIGLFAVKTVEVLSDACTEELQKWLDRGWRILAVCPPNGARRPDYIMGHFEREPHNRR